MLNNFFISYSIMAHYVIREERYRVIRKQQPESYMAPREEPFKMIRFEQIGKGSNRHQEDFSDDQYYYDHIQKPYHNHQQNPHVGHKGPYLHATVIHQKACPLVVNKGPNVETRIAPKGPHMEGSVTYHQGDMETSTTQVPQVMKKQGGVIDCNEAAKRYGGVVFTDYGRNNKYPLRA